MIKPIKTLIVHEFEQIRHIDSDQDGIRNMKISQDFYDHLQKLTAREPGEYTNDDYEFISDIHKIKYNKPPKVKEHYLNKILISIKLKMNIPLIQKLWSLIIFYHKILGRITCFFQMFEYF